MRQLAKIGFDQGYTYFTWKNTRCELTEYVDELAWGPEREYFRPNFFTNTPRHPQRVPRARRAGRVLHALRARRDAEPDLRDLLGLRALREHAAAARARRSTWTPRSTRSSSARSTGRCCRSSRASTRSGARTRRCSTSPTSPGSTPQNDQLMAYVKQHGRQRRHLRRQPRPHHAQEGSRDRARAPRPAARVRASIDQLSGERFDWRIGPQLRAARPVDPPGAHPARWRADDATAGPLVRGRAAVVQDGGLLRDPHPRLLRRQRRRLGRLPRPDREARLPAVARASTASGCCRSTSRRCATAATTSPTTSRSTPTTASSRTCATSSSRPTSAGSASSPTW